VRAGAISSQRLGQDIESRSRSNDVWDFDGSAVVSRSRDRQDCDRVERDPRAQLKMLTCLHSVLMTNP
jgi:hypothetical protein